MKQDFELVCVAFHENFSAEAESTVSAFKHVYYHADRWHFDTSRNVLVRYHKRPRKTLFVPSGTSDRPVALNKLAQERKTYIVDAQGNEKEIVDNWATSDHACAGLLLERKNGVQAYDSTFPAPASATTSEEVAADSAGPRGSTDFFSC